LNARAHERPRRAPAPGAAVALTAALALAVLLVPGLAYARKVAAHFGTDHTEFVVRPDALEVLPQLVWHFDEPFADASAIPTWYLSRLARERATVVLNGDGGDESFAGYDRYVANRAAARLAPLQPLLGSPAFRRALDLLPHGASSASARWRLKRFVQQLGRDPQARNAAWLAQFDLDSKRQLYSAAFRQWAGPRDAEEMLYARFREAEADNFTDASLYADITTYLPDTLLVKMDITSMAHGLEARSPFLDPRFAEFMARVPTSMKIKGRRLRYLERRLGERYLPPEVLARKKQGFASPLMYILEGEVRALAPRLLGNSELVRAGYLQGARVKQLVDEHLARRYVVSSVAQFHIA